MAAAPSRFVGQLPPLPSTDFVKGNNKNREKEKKRKGLGSLFLDEVDFKPRSHNLKEGI